MTRVKWEKKEGLVIINVSGSSSINLALTESLSSWRNAQTDLAFDWPTLPSSTSHHHQNQIPLLTKQKLSKSQINTHEVVSKVSKLDFGSINDGDAPNSTEDEILQGLWASGAAIEQTDARFFQSSLPYLPPYPAIRCDYFPSPPDKSYKREREKGRGVYTWVDDRTWF